MNKEQIKTEFSNAWVNEDATAFKNLILQHAPDKKQAFNDAWMNEDSESLKGLILSLNVPATVSSVEDINKAMGLQDPSAPASSTYVNQPDLQAQ